MGDHVAGEKNCVFRNTGEARTSQRSGNDRRVSSFTGKISFLSLVKTQILPLGIVVELLEEIKASGQQSNEKQELQGVYLNLTLAGRPWG